MRRTGDLFPMICSNEIIAESAKLSCAGRKDKHEVAMFQSREAELMVELKHLISDHAYITSGYRFCTKREHGNGKVRQIADLPLYPDRMVRRAYALVVIPVINRTLIDQTYASRPGKGTHAALAQAREYLDSYPKLVYCMSLDVHHCYENIDPDILEMKLERLIKDKDVLEELDYFIESYPRPGISIGDCFSATFCNLYLSEMDHYVKQELHAHAYIRYADNFFVFGNSREWLLKIKPKMDEQIEKIGLEFKPNWVIADLRREGVDFLGYRLYKDYVLLKDSTKIRMKRRVRDLEKRLDAGMVPTSSDMGMLSSYQGCLKWCNGYRLEQKCLAPVKARAVAKLMEAKVSEE